MIVNFVIKHPDLKNVRASLQVSEEAKIPLNAVITIRIHDAFAPNGYTDHDMRIVEIKDIIEVVQHASPREVSDAKRYREVVLVPKVVNDTSNDTSKRRK